jgi:hypothetical protein
VRLVATTWRILPGPTFQREARKARKEFMKILRGLCGLCVPPVLFTPSKAVPYVR